MKKFKNTYSFCNNDLNKFILLLRKGVYPYEYMDSWERFNETSLPSKKEFYSNLNMEDIDEIDYRWIIAWQLELLTDYDMLLMVEKGIRGGICHSIQRYPKANNKYMKNYNNNEESSYIQYLDANNLYGWAMSKKLPTNGFKWVDNNETAEPSVKHVINEDFIKNYNESNDKGYILELDVKYSKRLHELYSDLPFLSERMEVNKCKKLVCNLFNKKKYVVHINALKQALNHGWKLKKILRVIEFNQKAWLKPYIDMNTELRKAAKMILKKIFLN